MLCCAPLLAQGNSTDLRLAPSLRASVELRGRTELESFVIAGKDERSLANLARFRFKTEYTPFSWLRFTAHLQDSRTLTGPRIVGPLQDNHADAQHVYGDIGNSQDGSWSLRIGRQPLALGDERLVGADGFWCNRSQRFDGFRGTLRRGPLRWDLFSASPVEVNVDGPDRIGGSERISGVYGSWSRASGATIDGYFFWKRARSPSTDSRSGERYDRLTPGVLIKTPLRRGFEITAEIAAQRGWAQGTPVAAWAGFWEAARRFGGAEGSTRLALSYSRASGGRAGAATVGTFSDLNPAGYNAIGFFEPFAWRNIRDLRAAGEWSLSGGWRGSAEFHSYWLATVQDGVYIDGGPYVAYNPAAPSARLGARALAGGSRSFGRHLELAIGYARFFPAAYMKAGMSMRNSAFVSWTLRR